MMKKRIAPFIILILSFLLLPSGMAMFSFLSEDVIFDYRDENNDSTGLSYVTFDYCDANMTDDYKYYFDSSTVFSSSRVPEPNVNNGTHSFQGWYTDASYTTPLNFSTHNFVHGERFYALYKNTSLTTFTGTSALNIYNGSPTTSPMFFSKYNTTGTMDISAKIDVRYSSSGTYNSSTAGDNSATVYRLPYDAKTRIILDCDITISSGGTLQLSSVLGVASGNNYNGIISNVNYTAMDLNGHTITVKNGGALNAYGIIHNSKNRGGIIVESGGSMTTVFGMADFKGGTNLVGSYQKALMSFASYSTPYWFCETVFYSGGKLYGETSLCASSSKYSTTAELIGNSTASLIQLTAGYIIRKAMDFDYFLNRTVDYGNITSINTLLSSAYRSKLIFTNDLAGKLDCLNLGGSTSASNVVINSLSMKVSVGVTVNVSMAYGDFPICPHLDVEAYSTTLTINMSLVAMPSSTIMIDENSTLVFTTSSPNSYTIYARLTAIDEYPNDFYYLKNGTRTAGTYYLDARLINSTVPATIDMRGTFNFNTASVTTSSDFNKYSIGGRIKLSEQALNSLIAQKDYVNLQSKFFYPMCYGYSASTFSKYMFALAARYYFAPIISDDTIYFQLNGSSDILVGEVYDTYNGLFKYNDDVYFMYYTNRSNTTTYWSFSMTNSNPPSSSEQTNKYNNTAGQFVKVDSILFAVDDATFGRRGQFITYNGNNYVYVNGAYIMASPSTGGNTVATITGITNGEKFNISDTQSGGVNNEPKCGTKLQYDNKTERWQWA